MKGVTFIVIVGLIYLIISIHTPMKGVTPESLFDKLTPDISIHTPMKGVTKNGELDLHDLLNFNPHSHEGSDSNFVQFRTFIF